MMALRGERIEAALTNPDEWPKVMSSCNVWIKDMSIVKSLWSENDPNGVGRLAAAALESFETAKSKLDLGNQDDSTVVKIYDEKNATKVHDVEACDVGDEPVHNVVLNNRFARVMVVKFAEGEETQVHTHKVDSFYFFLSPPIICGDVGAAPSLRNLKVISTSYNGNVPTAGIMEMEYGEVRFGDHCTNPLTHKIKCLESGNHAGMFCIDVEFKEAAPDVLNGGKKGIPVGEGVELVKKRGRMNVGYVQCDSLVFSEFTVH